MKKIISVILTICLMLSTGICFAYATETETTAKISTATALPSEKVEIFISLDCADGIKTLSFYDFTYDNSDLTIVESECEWLAAGKLSDIDFENNASIITFEENTPYSGNIMKLVFSVSESAEIGTLPVSCKVIGTQMIGNIETEMDISIIDGGITVTDSSTDLSDFEYELNAEGIVITAYIGDKKTVVINDSYEIDGVSYDVVEIAESAFETNEIVESVTIPETVSKIGDYAFYDCLNLTSVTILGKDTQIGEVALGYYYISRREDGVVEGFTIYGYEGSSADTYAASEKEITFVALEENKSIIDEMSSQIRFNKNEDKTYAGTFDIRSRAKISDADFNKFIGATNEDAIQNIKKVGFVYSVNPEAFSAEDAKTVAKGGNVSGYTDAPVYYIQDADGYYMFTCLVTGIPTADKNYTLVSYAYICVEINGVENWYFAENKSETNYNTLFTTYFPIACEQFGWEMEV